MSGYCFFSPIKMQEIKKRPGCFVLAMVNCGGGPGGGGAQEAGKGRKEGRTKFTSICTPTFHPNGNLKHLTWFSSLLCYLHNNPVR